MLSPPSKGIVPAATPDLAVGVVATCACATISAISVVATLNEVVGAVVYDALPVLVEKLAQSSFSMPVLYRYSRRD